MDFPILKLLLSSSFQTLQNILKNREALKKDKILMERLFRITNRSEIKKPPGL